MLPVQTMKRSWNSDSTEEVDAKRQVPGREHRISALTSLSAPVSPPRRSSTVDGHQEKKALHKTTPPDLAAIEAGHVEVTDHLDIFSTRLSEYARPLTDSQPTPRLPINEWINLYRRNEHPKGHHFVIHQHDHPVAGPHYDLRLQFSETSSVSWSIMYGLPGDPNSQRLNRNATETRVHCLWVGAVASCLVCLLLTMKYEEPPYRDRVV